MLPTDKDNAAPAPMVPDHAVLEWGVLHRQLMQESDVSRHDIIAAIWVASFSRWQRYRCGQGERSRHSATQPGGWKAEQVPPVSDPYASRL